MNRKGFTLIELLAVVIILGILMMIAVPAVTGVINESRKTAYVDTANNYVDAVKKAIESRKLKVLQDGSLNFIPIDTIVYDGGAMKSPFGDWATINQTIKYIATDKDEILNCGLSNSQIIKGEDTNGYKLYNPNTSKNDTSKTYNKVTQGCMPKNTLHDAWVVVKYDTIKDKYEYYWTSRDVTNMSVAITNIEKLTEKDIKKGSKQRVTFRASTRIAKPVSTDLSNLTFQVNEIYTKTSFGNVNAHLVMMNKAVYGGKSRAN